VCHSRENAVAGGTFSRQSEKRKLEGQPPINGWGRSQKRVTVPNMSLEKKFCPQNAVFNAISVISCLIKKIFIFFKFYYQQFGIEKRCV